MRLKKRLLPAMALDKACEVLNEFCCDHQVTGQYSVEDLLALAISGDVNLSVVLPEDFLVLYKNELRYDEGPLRPRFPKGSSHCFINRATAYRLSIHPTASLGEVFTISNERAMDQYRSVNPGMAISLADIRITDEQVLRLMSDVSRQDQANVSRAILTKMLSTMAEREMPSSSSAVEVNRNATHQATPLVDENAGQSASKDTGSIFRKSGRRSHPLDAVIARAEKEAADANDRQSVWAALVKIASAENPPAPLMGYSDGEGVKYVTYEQQKDDTFVGFYTKGAFMERCRRNAKAKHTS